MNHSSPNIISWKHLLMLWWHRYMFAESAVRSLSRSPSTRVVPRWPTCPPRSSRMWVWSSQLAMMKIWRFICIHTWCCAGKGPRSSSWKWHLWSNAPGQFSLQIGFKISCLFLSSCLFIFGAWFDRRSDIPPVFRSPPPASSVITTNKNTTLFLHPSFGLRWIRSSTTSFFF